MFVPMQNPAPVPDERVFQGPRRGPPPPKSAQNPYAQQTADDIKAYEDYTYGYPMDTLGAPRQMAPQNFDLMRQRAMQTVGAGVQSGTLTGMSQLAASGGLSAAD